MRVEYNGILSVVVNCVWYDSHSGSGKGRGKTSLVDGYQILQCGEEYPGSVGRGSFPGIFQGADQRLP
jgi:hypothetical protein